MVTPYPNKRLYPPFSHLAHKVLLLMCQFFYIKKQSSKPELCFQNLQFSKIFLSTLKIIRISLTSPLYTYMSLPYSHIFELFHFRYTFCPSNSVNELILKICKIILSLHCTSLTYSSFL